MIKSVVSICKLTNKKNKKISYKICHEKETSFGAKTHVVQNLNNKIELITCSTSFAFKTRRKRGMADILI